MFVFFLLSLVAAFQKLSVYQNPDCRRNDERAYVLPTLTGCFRIKNFDGSDLVKITDYYNGSITYYTQCDATCTKCGKVRYGVARTIATITCYNFADNYSLSRELWSPSNYFTVMFYQQAECNTESFGYAYPLDTCIKNKMAYSIFSCDASNRPYACFSPSSCQECILSPSNDICNSVSNTRYLCQRSAGMGKVINTVLILLVLIIHGSVL